MAKHWISKPNLDRKPISSIGVAREQEGRHWDNFLLNRNDESRRMTHLAKELRSQAHYIRSCLQQGNLGYADAKMQEKLERAAARITTQNSSLDDLQTFAKDQAALNEELTRSNGNQRHALEQVVEALSATLTKMHSDSTSETCSSYKLFETLELARKALK
ncbi:hypothetical protein [Cohaesibacter celericrescens]|nr:hypothetical protein [Cohaesibacter celericrescens]